MRVEYFLELEDGSGELAFEWDSDKASSNLTKHLISFEEAITIFLDDVMTEEDTTARGELIEKSYGLLKSQSGSTVVICVVHTDRDRAIRVISARKATAQERKNFNDYYRKTLH